MSEYNPICTAAEADHLDMDECVAGYLSGLRDDPEPGSDKSKSFWHGWRNGMIDKGRIPPDAASSQLARELVRRQKVH